MSVWTKKYPTRRFIHRGHDFTIRIFRSFISSDMRPEKSSRISSPRLERMHIVQTCHCNGLIDCDSGAMIGLHFTSQDRLASRHGACGSEGLGAHVRSRYACLIIFKEYGDNDIARRLCDRWVCATIPLSNHMFMSHSNGYCSVLMPCSRLCDGPLRARLRYITLLTFSLLIEAMAMTITIIF